MSLLTTGRPTMQSPLGDIEPTAADLAAIEAEWPVIAEDLAALDREIAALTLGDRLDELAVRRARRKARGALRAPLGLAALGGEVA